MHSQVLESQKYPEITFSPGKLSGPLARPGQSSVQLQGSFRLHGDDHTISLTVPVQITGDTVMAKAQFVIPYVAWGLKNPSTFLLHVSDKVQVDVTAVGHITK
jgi:polyisoprenoid-binding protein YceI